VTVRVRPAAPSLSHLSW